MRKPLPLPSRLNLAEASVRCFVHSLNNRRMYSRPAHGCITDYSPCMATQKRSHTAHPRCKHYTLVPRCTTAYLGQGSLPCWCSRELSSYMAQKTSCDTATWCPEMKKPVFRAPPAPPPPPRTNAHKIEQRSAKTWADDKITRTTYSSTATRRLGQHSQPSPRPVSMIEVELSGQGKPDRRGNPVIISVQHRPANTKVPNKNIMLTF